MQRTDKFFKEKTCQEFYLKLLVTDTTRSAL